MTLLSRIEEYLTDDLSQFMWREIRRAGPLRAISLDLTHLCNIRCKGCYFFAESMDQYQAPSDDSQFDEFVEQEIKRGTNFVTVLGGEPSLELGRLKKLYDRCRIVVVTNGIKAIPFQGFENLPIGISVWGNRETDKELRGSGRIDVFQKALRNYTNDERAIWYYTTSPGRASEMHDVVRNLEGLGGDYDHRTGFAAIRREIDRMIELYPDRILFSSYLNRVISTGKLYGQQWGYDACCSITFDHPLNQERIQNGNAYNPHFRAYYPDLKTTRRCCVGEARDCATCFDVWAHMSWIMLHLEEHLATAAEFTNYLTTLYLFYLAARLVDFAEGIKRLPEIHLKTFEADVQRPTFGLAV